MSKRQRKVGLITGGIGDLGYASAAKMAEMGMDLVLVDIKENPSRIDALEATGAKVLYLRPTSPAGRP